MTTTGAKCNAIRRNGTPCQSWAVNGSSYCQAHDPQRAAQMAAARRAGGHARHGRKIGATGQTPTVTLHSMEDVLELLTLAANDVLGLEASINRARALAYIAATWAKCYETSELERRLSALEVRLQHDAQQERATHEPGSEVMGRRSPAVCALPRP
jgi:hypothetical protein